MFSSLKSIFSDYGTRNYLDNIYDFINKQSIYPFQNLKHPDLVIGFNYEPNVQSDSLPSKKWF